jgi:hypothetical protein
MPEPTRASAARPFVVLAVVVGLIWGFTELVCWGGLWALERYKDLEYAPQEIRELSDKHRGVLESYLAGEPSYMIFSPTLGWTIGRNASNATYHANGQGLRATHDYTPAPLPGRLRIAAFGDSFTHSSDVPDNAAWEVVLEHLDPRLEVLNFGVPGYGLDQAYLRYRELGEGFHPQVVLIGFMSDNISRIVNVYRPFFFYQSGLPLTKPRFTVRGGRLELIENPIQSLQGYRELLDHPEQKLDQIGQHDFFFQRRNQRSRFDFLPSVRFVHVLREQYTQPIIKDGAYNPRSEAYQVATGIFDRFYGEAAAHGAVPILVFFPDKPDLRAHREGRTKVYGPLIQYAERRGYRYIDLLDAFDRYGKDAELNELVHIHYTRQGCTMVAQWILDYLRAHGIAAAAPPPPPAAAGSPAKAAAPAAAVPPGPQAAPAASAAVPSAANAALVPPTGTSRP